MHVAIIGGASTIGATAASALVGRFPTAQITLIDVDEAAARGQARDLRHGAYHHADAPRESGSGIEGGTVRAIHPDRIDSISPDVAIVTANVGEQPEEPLDRDFRTRRVDDRMVFLEDIGRQLEAIGPLPTLVVTNPVDRVTYYLWRSLEWSREQFIGYSLSEAARAAAAIGRHLETHPNRVWCPTLGEHGERLVLAFSQATVDGEPVGIDEAAKAAIRERVLDTPIEIANARGVADSSRWVTSAGILRVVTALCGTATDRPMCLSVPVDGEYGLQDGCLSLPVMVGPTGVTRVIEWELPDDELSQLHAAHEGIRGTLPEIEP